MWTASSRITAALLVSAVALCAAVTAASSPPAPSASASAAASSSAGAAPSGSASAEAALPLLRAADVPAEPSDPPKPKDWAGGRRVRPLREAGGTCKFVVLREWLHIECDRMIGATLIGGEPADVKIFAAGGPFVQPDPEHPPNEPLALTSPPAKVLITVRLKRGETKLFSLLAALNDYNPQPFEYGYVAVTWPPQREDPTILISRRDD